jgi:sugar/nucleoside kinase (ribokinase family)
MSQTTKLITGMGAALVDLFAHVSEAELAALGSPKASMSLVEPARSDEMQKAVHVHESQPGGSIANSIAGIAALGVASGFIGKIGDDALGAVFTDAFTRANVRFPVTPMDALPTGHCLVLVTPDAERTMHTVLGASVTTDTADIDAALLADTGLLFGEGYLWDSPSARGRVFGRRRWRAPSRWQSGVFAGRWALCDAPSRRFYGATGQPY